MSAHRSRLFGWRMFQALPLVIVMAGVAVGCGASTTPPAATATPTPPAFHGLVVEAAVKAPGASAITTTLVALDPATGRLLWQHALNGYPGGESPAIVGGQVIVSTGVATNSYPGTQVAAYDARTGAPRWQTELPANTQGHVFAAGAAVLLATSAVSAAAPNASRDLTITALQPTTGVTIWQTVQPDEELVGPVRHSGDTVFVTSGRLTTTPAAYTLTAYRAATGSRLWQRAAGTGTLIGSAADAGGVYISLYAGQLPALRDPSSGGAVAAAPRRSSFRATLTAYRASDGSPLWQVDGFVAAQTALAGVLYATNAVAGVSGKAAFAVVAYQTATGAQRWQSNSLNAGDITQDKPFVVADAHAAYVFNMPETPRVVHALTGASGTQLWTALPSHDVQFAVAGGDVVFAAALPSRTPGQPPQTAPVTLYALRAPLGDTVWHLTLANSVQARLALV